MIQRKPASADDIFKTKVGERVYTTINAKYPSLRPYIAGFKVTEVSAQEGTLTGALIIKTNTGAAYIPILFSGDKIVSCDMIYTKENKTLVPLNSDSIKQLFSDAGTIRGEITNDSTSGDLSQILNNYKRPPVASGSWKYSSDKPVNLGLAICEAIDADPILKAEVETFYDLSQLKGAKPTVEDMVLTPTAPTCIEKHEVAGMESHMLAGFNRDRILSKGYSLNEYTNQVVNIRPRTMPTDLEYIAFTRNANRELMQYIPDRDIPADSTTIIADVLVYDEYGDIKILEGSVFRQINIDEMVVITPLGGMKFSLEDRIEAETLRATSSGAVVTNVRTEMTEAELVELGGFPAYTLTNETLVTIHDTAMFFTKRINGKYVPYNGKDISFCSYGSEITRVDSENFYTISYTNRSSDFAPKDGNKHDKILIIDSRFTPGKIAPMYGEQEADGYSGRSSIKYLISTDVYIVPYSAVSCSTFFGFKLVDSRERAALGFESQTFIELERPDNTFTLITPDGVTSHIKEASMARLLNATYGFTNKDIDHLLRDGRVSISKIATEGGEATQENTTQENKMLSYVNEKDINVDTQAIREGAAYKNPDILEASFLTSILDNKAAHEVLIDYIPGFSATLTNLCKALYHLQKDQDTSIEFYGEEEYTKLLETLKTLMDKMYIVIRDLEKQMIARI